MKQILFATCIFFAMQLIGQDVNKKISFALKAGLGTSNLGPSYTGANGDKYEFNSKTTFIGGLSVQVPIGKKLMFTPEMILINKGAMEKINGQHDYTSRKDLYYWEFPLNLSYIIKTKSGFFSIGGGPAPALILYDPYSYERGEIANFDLGINLLTTYQFPIGFSMELNYNKGLIDISRNSNYRLKNSYLGFCIGYAF